ncbi:hypothetical protein Hanom_Chr00s000001g01595321 [Helianthus anomalus]
MKWNGIRKFFFVKLILVGGGRNLKSFTLIKFVTISTFLRNPSYTLMKEWNGMLK